MPTLAVPPLEVDADNRASEAIIKEFRAAGRVYVIEGAAVDRYLKSQTRSSRSQKSLKEASSLLLKGQEAYRKLQIKESINLLGKAKVAYRSQLSDEASFEGLRAAQFHLAMAYLANKDEARAREEIHEIVILDPERESRQISKRLYSPTIRSLYSEIQYQVKNKGHGDLQIVTTPPGALAYVDGKSVGATPARVKNLPVGEHFVRIQLEEREVYSGSKFVVGGENQFEPELKRETVRDISGYFDTVQDASAIDHKRAAFLDEMGLALGAEIFVFIGPEHAQVRGQLYDQRSQEVSPMERDATPQGLVLKLSRHLDNDGYVIRRTTIPAVAQALPSSLPTSLQPKASGSIAEQTQPKPEKKESVMAWYKNRWVWMGIGSVVLFFGGTALLLFTDIAKTNPTTSHVMVTLPGR